MALADEVSAAYMQALSDSDHGGPARPLLDAVADRQLPAGESQFDVPLIHTEPAAAPAVESEPAAPDGQSPSEVLSKRTCAKCAVPCDAGTCNKCNTRRSTLSQMYGHWPIAFFRELSLDQQTLFWQADCKGKREIEVELTQSIAKHKTEKTRTQCAGQYLPLSVYKTQGYDIADIEARCEDVQDHAVLGKVYRVEISGKTTEEITATVKADLFELKLPRVAANDTPPSSSKAVSSKKSKKRKRSSSSSSGSGSSSSNDKSKAEKASDSKAKKAQDAKDKAAEEKKEKLVEAQRAKAMQIQQKHEAKERSVMMTKMKKQMKDAQTAHAQITAPLLELNFMADQDYGDDLKDLLAAGQQCLAELADVLKATKLEAFDYADAKRLATEMKAAIAKIKRGK